MKSLYRFILLALAFLFIGLGAYFSYHKKDSNLGISNQQGMMPIPTSELKSNLIENFKNGNADSFKRYLKEEIEVNILDEQDWFSSSETVDQLTQFFENHPPKKFTSKHSGSSRSGRGFYLVGNYTDMSDNVFRIHVASENELIHIIEIEN